VLPSRLLRTLAIALLLTRILHAQTTPTDTYPPSSTIQSPGISQPATVTQTGVAPPPTNPLADRDIGDTASPRTQQPTQNSPTQQSIPQPPAPPTEFQQFVADTTGRTLPLFGAAIFNSAPSTFAPVDNIPVTSDYVIGPGDELRLQISGQVNLRGNLIVDRTGAISLPEVGTIHVAGLQFSQLAGFLKAQLARVYRNFDLNVNLGQLRSIQVFVVGQARQPGVFTISSLSTLLNALFASGGPTPQGSLRDIQVKRDGATITHFDLYDLLLHGDKSKDIRLLPGDVIFIPAAGPQVAVSGSVATPAIYELRDEKSFAQVIALAGGLTTVAANTRARVDRIYKHAERSVIDVDLNSSDNSPVQDGDIVNVLAVINRFQNAVTLRGNVVNPGRFAWVPGMKVSDLIPSRDALITRDYYLRQAQLGQSTPDYTANRTEGSLSVATNTSTATPTPPQTTTNQQSINPQQSSSTQQTTNTGSGNGGSSLGATLTDTNSTFAAKNDVILSAPDIDWNYAVIERQSATDLTTSLLPFNLSKAVIDHDPAQDLELLAGDVVTIFSQADIRVPSAQQTKFVKLEGEFVAAGVYSVQPGETLHHLLARAGGFTPDADLYASEFTRDSVRRLQRQRLLEFADTLESEISANTSARASTALTDRDAAAAEQASAAARAAVQRLRQAQPSGRIVFQLKPDSSGIAAVPDIELQDGDRFVVPRTPATVTVEGQVTNANAFLYARGKRVKDYLRLAGGPDRVGDRGREFLLRADGSVVSHQYSSLAHRALFADSDFEDAQVLPGDTIVVPPIVTKGAIMRDILDVSTIIQGFGLGAAAIQVLK
jgi:protein involved in polysaccharide export with SLBB domain